MRAVAQITLVGILLICGFVISISAWQKSLKGRQVGTIEGVATAIPDVFVDAISKDVGTVIRSGTAHVSFMITNRGASALRITELSASCGCTSVQSDSHLIGPAQHADISAVLDASRAGQTPFKKEIYVKFDGQPLPLVLDMTGSIDLEKSTVIYPNRLEIESIVPGAVIERQLFVNANKNIIRQIPSSVHVILGAKPLSITLQGGQNKEATDDDYQTRTISVQVEAPERISEGDSETSIKWHFADLPGVELDVPIRAVIGPRVRCEPPLIYFTGKNFAFDVISTDSSAIAIPIVRSTMPLTFQIKRIFT